MTTKICVTVIPGNQKTCDQKDAVPVYGDCTRPYCRRLCSKRRFTMIQRRKCARHVNKASLMPRQSKESRDAILATPSRYMRELVLQGQLQRPGRPVAQHESTGQARLWTRRADRQEGRHGSSLPNTRHCQPKCHHDGPRGSLLGGASGCVRDHELRLCSMRSCGVAWRAGVE